MSNLFNCFEPSSLAASKIAERLKNKYGLETKLFFSLPWHSIIDRPKEEAGDQDFIDLFSFYGKNKSLKIFSKYNGDHKRIYKLKNFTKEEEELLIKDINLDPILLSDISGRFYNKSINRSDLLRYADFLCEFFCAVLEKEKPSFILDIENFSLLRKILLITCNRYNVTYISLIHTRLDNFVLLTKTLGLELKKENKLRKNLSEKKIKDFIKYYTNRESLLNKDEVIFQKKQISSLSIIFFLKTLYKIFRQIVYCVSIKVNETNIPIEKRGLGKIINPSVVEGTVYNLISSIREFINSLPSFEKKIGDLKNQKYFYFPLAYLLEGMQSGEIGNALNDDEIISRIRPFVPLGLKVLMKEHRSMILERSFYSRSKLSQIPSMHFLGKSIKSNYFLESKELIIKSLGIICHSGTTGLEAAILQKPLLLFGNPVYNQYIEHTPEISHLEIREYFKNPKSFIPEINKVKEYINVVLSNGYNVKQYSKLVSGNPVEEDIDKISDLFYQYISDKII